MGRESDTFSIPRIDGFPQRMKMPGELLSENRQDVAQQLAVVFQVSEQFCNIKSQIRRFRFRLFHGRSSSLKRHRGCAASGSKIRRRLKRTRPPVVGKSRVSMAEPVFCSAN